MNPISPHSPRTYSSRGFLNERGFRRGGSGRGSFRPRGAGWAGYGPRPELSPLLSVEPTPPRGKLLESIHREVLEGEEDATATITDCELIATYNWLEDADRPTILVPGSPPLWTPPQHPYPIPQDSGDFYRDKNAARFPSHPWEPAAVAVLEIQPQGGGNVDIVCCGSTLGNLLRFVRGSDRPFQFLVDMVGDAVHFTRRENKPDETMRDVRGYGHTFPQAYTTWSAAAVGSTSHQRIVRYTFAGLSLMLRFESDGYLDPSAERPPEPETPTTTVDQLTTLMGDSLGTSSPALPKDKKPPVQLRRGGMLVPQDKVFDIKTRGLWRKAQITVYEDELPRLWASQTPRLITAYHDKGRFPIQHIEIHEAREGVAKFEEEQAKALSALSALLRRIMASAEQHKHLEVVYEAEGTTLELRTQVEGSEVAFSPDVQERWLKWLQRAPLSANETQAATQVDEDEDFSKCSAGCGYCGVASAH